MKVIITGASGILGSAVQTAFTSTNSKHDVLGLCFSNAKPGLTKLDLLDTAETERVFRDFNPDWVIHCAAERRPDVADKDPEGTRKLNVSVPESLAKLSKKLGFTLIYISTDYVFDGTSPPYTPAAQTNPVNFYGQTKRDGELAILGVDGAKAIALRVPVLYGPAPKNSDTAVNVLLDVVQDQSGKTYKMDHYATRYPTNVVDIAGFLARLTTLKTPLPPILHYSAPEPFTKYEMCLVFAKILGLPHAHIIADASAPAPGAAVSRPRDCQLYTKETEVLSVPGGLGCEGFEEWWTTHLGKTRK